MTNAKHNKYARLLQVKPLKDWKSYKCMERDTRGIKDEEIKQAIKELNQPLVDLIDKINNKIAMIDALQKQKMLLAHELAGVDKPRLRLLKKEIRQKIIDIKTAYVSKNKK